MKKLINVFLITMAMALMLLVPNETAYAANATLKVSDSSIEIGDTVKVTVSVPEDITATINIKFDPSVLEYTGASISADFVGVGNGAISINVGKYGDAASVSVNFKAKTAAETQVTAEVVKAGNALAEPVELGGASKTITIKNEVVTPPDPGPTNPQEPTKSADNSLSSIKLSKGKLSPNLDWTITKYKATVDYSVKEITITATTSHPKAVIESITGNGKPIELKVGKNVIEIVVRAENGQKEYYTITVTREAENANSSESETPEPSDEPDVPNEVLKWNGAYLESVEKIPDSVVPAGFKTSTQEIGGEKLPILKFKNEELKLLYLESAPDADGKKTKGLYVYDEARNSIYPFVKLESENSYIMVLMPNPEKAPAPIGFTETTITIPEKGTVTGYQFPQGAAEQTTTSWLDVFAPEVFYAAEPVLTDYYLLYCMNESGETGWYVFDAVEQTYQRYLGSLHGNTLQTEDTQSTEEPDTQTQVQVPGNQDIELEKELEKTKNLMYIIIGAAALVVLVLVIIIIVLLVRRRREDEYDDVEFFESRNTVETKKATEVVAPIPTSFEKDEAIPVKKTEDVGNADNEDDELEIEFYEMEEIQEESDADDEMEKEISEDDDEVEVEFFEIPEVTVSEEELQEIEAATAAIAPAEEKLSELDRILKERKGTAVEEDDDDFVFIDLD